MRNADVVDKFIDGEDDNRGSNLYSENGKLYNFSTIIAMRHPMGLILNGDKYSPTTSVHQNRIRRDGVEYVETNEKGLKDIMYTGDTQEKMIFMRNEKPIEDVMDR